MDLPPTGFSMAPPQSPWASGQETWGWELCLPLSSLCMFVSQMNNVRKLQTVGIHENINACMFTQK